VVTLRWAPPLTGSTPSGYLLEGGVSPGEVLAGIPTGSPSPYFTFTAPTGAFFVRLHAIGLGGRSPASNEIRLFVNTSPPSAPADLLGLVNGSSLALAWRNTFDGGAPTSMVLDVTGSLTLSVPVGLTDSFRFDGVPSGTYTFSVRGINAGGPGASSNAVTLTFPGACSGPPQSPANFGAYRDGHGRIHRQCADGRTAPERNRRAGHLRPDRRCDERMRHRPGIRGARDHGPVIRK
jgi:hypothetical protein